MSRKFTLYVSLTLFALTFLYFGPFDRRQLLNSWREAKSTYPKHSASTSDAPDNGGSTADTHTEFSPLYLEQESSTSSESVENQHHTVKPLEAPSNSSDNLSPHRNNLPSISKDRPLRIAITETMGWHDEVYAALVHAFGSQPNTELTLFLKKPRYSMPYLLQTFHLTNPLPKHTYNGLEELDKYEPDIVVSATCEHDVRNIKGRMDTLFDEGKTHWFCVGHFSSEWDNKHCCGWLEDGLTKWIEAGRLTILTLSPHVKKALKTYPWGLTTWKSLEQEKGTQNVTALDMRKKIAWPPIEVFVPVFPAPKLETGSNVGKSFAAAKAQEHVAFAIQGIVMGTRNYTRIITYFDDFLHSASASKKYTPSDLSLHIIGSGGDPNIPASVKDFVFLDKNLDYPDYYAQLSQNTALFAAFDENHIHDETQGYLTVKATSSVPASVIAGIPMVLKRETLDAYSYLEKENVWLVGKEETEEDVIQRIVEAGAAERKKKLETVRRFRDRLIEGNVDLVGKWIGEALDSRG